MRQITPLSGRRLRLPIVKATKLRIAQLTTTPVFEGAKVINASNWRELSVFAPHVLIASVSDYGRLMDRMSLRTVDVTSVDHALFVLTAVGDRPLTDQMRGLLWERFGVPVYELYVDGQGGLLAADCEAQEGWHFEATGGLLIENGELLIRSRNLELRTGLAGLVEEAACPCGVAGPRLVCAPLDKAGDVAPALAAAS